MQEKLKSWARTKTKTKGERVRRKRTIGRGLGTMMIWSYWQKGTKYNKQQC